jgi:SAM-dependent methyltransferase
MTTGRKTDAEYWNKTWNRTAGDRLRRRKRQLPPSPFDVIFWRELLPGVMPPAPARIIELGSAPGQNLLQWRQFNYDIYGADYSAIGIAEQRRTFAEAGVPPEHSIHADIFDPAFQKQWGEYFDVAYSAGVIEHFDDPAAAIDAHLAILKAGGLLVITIPNFAGLMGSLLPKDILRTHNLEIMQLPRFRELFQRPTLEALHCRYIGKINFVVADSGHSRFTSRMIGHAQRMINMTLQVLPFPETSWLSPQLLYIGRKSPA